jgi:hypothetical protein
VALFTIATHFPPCELWTSVEDLADEAVLAVLAVHTVHCSCQWDQQLQKAVRLVLLWCLTGA